ncbi:alpha/beta hydrolase [Amphritea sp. HPY]|uniref:alpha/beta hydrolase n=1 Tax=Amphritea sp. HPY TaxID=3421652 RepID=UPI003D7DA9C9
MKMMIELTLRLTSMFAFIYLLLLLFIYLNQTQLLYFPDQYRPPEKLISSQHMQPWPASNNHYRGLLATPQSPVKGTIIIFHGNAGSAWDRRFYIRPLTASGYRVILSEYPGYGGRPGPLNEDSLVSDARETVNTATEQFGGPIILLGESLGAAVAAAASAQSNSPVTALVLITPWDSLPELAQTLYWYLPARWLTRDRYNNSQSLIHFTGRTAVLIAERDEIIPAAHSLRFYEKLIAPKQLWVFKDANHNSWPTDAQASWWLEVTQFIEAP